MNHDVTLDQLTPRMTNPQKVILGCLIAAILVILACTYLWIGIDPLRIYHKRENAFSYLFGRQLSAIDRENALQQARRLPRVIALQDALQQVKLQYQKQGRTPDSATLQKEADRLAEQILASQSESDREQLIAREYARILDEKKGGFFPPETHWSRLKAYSQALLETIAIAIWGSLLAVVFAIPGSLLAARNTLELMFQGDSRWLGGVRWFSHFIFRRFLDFCRGFNEFVMALIFVAVIGLGPFAGVLALFIHTFGILGKVFSEAIEAIEPGQVEAVMASGASAPQIISFSVLPQVMPLFVSYSLLRFESNVRSATILGFVGAGGIGFLMFDKLNGYQYREVATMMIMVIISVCLIDYLCGKLRSYFM